MRLARNVVILIVWAAGMATWVWWKYLLPEAQEGSANAAQALMSKRPEAWQHTTESAWLVHAVARDCAQMLLFAAEGKNYPSPGAEVALALVPGQTESYSLKSAAPRGEAIATVEVRPHVWAVKSYSPWVKALLSTWKLASVAPSTPAGSQDLIKALTEPKTGTIVEEGLKLTDAISASPLDPDLHERAALLTGALALREAAGHFSDCRKELCRMTAHLAIAATLRPQMGTEGLLANAVLLSLARRQVEALELVQALEGRNDLSLEPWALALKMRNTGDWRLSPDPAGATLLEQREHGRALVWSRDTGALTRFLEQAEPETMPDWARMGTERDFSVEEGHQLATKLLSNELADAESAWKGWTGKEFDAENLPKHFNENGPQDVISTQSGSARMEIPGWNLLAAFHQRHFCHGLVRTHHFLDEKWGVQDEASGLELQAQSKLQGLQLLPFVLVRIASDSESHAEAFDNAVKLCQTRPDMVTSCNWALLLDRSNVPSRAPAAPSPQYWFAPELLPGTAYDFDSRYYDLRNLYRATNEAWDAMLAIAPYDFEVIRTHRYKKHGNQPNFEQTKTAYARISEYHLTAMRETADHLKHDPQAYLLQMRKACQLDPDLFIQLGHYLVEHRLDEEAVVAYLAAFEMAKDRVYMANNSKWIVNYLYTHQRKDEALKIASAAAEVYSYGGLETMAALMERMKNWDEAARYYLAISERYDDNTPFTAFVFRHRDEDTRFQETYEKLTASVFPEGMIETRLADFTAPPTSGIMIGSDTPRTRQHRIAKGHVIVALDGYKVGTVGQYTFVRSLKEDDVPLELILWDGTKYRQLSAQVPNRKFECALENYSP